MTKYLPTNEVPDERVEEQIQLRQEILDRMVGTLYPRIILGELNVLYHRRWQLANASNQEK